MLFLHALFILWVVFGALLIRSRPVLRWLHIISLVWGIFTELLPWPCPLTVLENWLEAKAGVEPYHGGFLLHYLDKIRVSRHLRDPSDGCRSARLRFQSWTLWTANVDRPSHLSFNTSEPYPVCRNETKTHSPSGFDDARRRM